MPDWEVMPSTSDVPPLPQPCTLEFVACVGGLTGQSRRHSGIQDLNEICLIAVCVARDNGHGARLKAVLAAAKGFCLCQFLDIENGLGSHDFSSLWLGSPKRCKLLCPSKANVPLAVPVFKRDYLDTRRPCRPSADVSRNRPGCRGQHRLPTEAAR